MGHSFKTGLVFTPSFGLVPQTTGERPRDSRPATSRGCTYAKGELWSEWAARVAKGGHQRSRDGTPTGLRSVTPGSGAHASRETATRSSIAASPCLAHVPKNAKSVPQGQANILVRGVSRVPDEGGGWRIPGRKL